MVVAAGVTVTGVPLMTGPTPLLILPVPPEKTGVKVVDVPAAIVAAPAVKLVMAGAAITVTVAVAVLDVPALFVTVRV